VEVNQRHLSGLLLGLGISLILGVGIIQLLKDGSFTRDEAAVVLNLLELGSLELIGPLQEGQHFPRLYLLLIAQLKAILGFHTLVLRLLPYFFFVGATILWLRLFGLRFGSHPLMLSFAIILSLVSTPWLTYSANLKQYTFETFLALVPFSIADTHFDEWLRKGRRVWKLLLLTIFCAMSYTYAIALLARTAGWYFGGLAGGGARCIREGVQGGRHRLNLRAVSVFAFGILFFLISLWFTDVRHTVQQGGLFRFWAQCILANVWGEWGQMVALLDRFAFGWYAENLELVRKERLPSVVLTILKIAFCLGLLGIACSLFRRRSETAPESAGWGTRSLGCLFCVGALPAASLLIHYPICAGRLTLFVSWCLQIVLLEGLFLLCTILSKLRWGQALSRILLVLLALLVLPTAIRGTAHVIQSDVPENIRPLIQRTRERSDLPILVLKCMQKQARTLPEGFGSADVRYPRFGHDWSDLVPFGGEAWVLNVRRGWVFCQMQMARVRRLASSVEAFHTPKDTADLYLVRFPQTQPDAIPQGSPRTPEEGP
jgi:hypothetical protein